MYLNTFSAGLDPLDMTGVEEFRSLLASASELGIEAPDRVRYLSRNTVFRHQRFHYLEWGKPGRPPVVLLHGGNLPVLIVRGAESNVLEQGAAERFASALSRAELAVVGGCGHNVASGNTAGFLAALNPFLDRVHAG